jgi:hypothetical protein
MENRYKFNSRAMFNSSILTSTILFLWFKKDSLVGLRPKLDKIHMLVLPQAGTVFFSGDPSGQSFIMLMFMLLLIDVQKIDRTISILPLASSRVADACGASFDCRNEIQKNNNQKYTGKNVKICVIDSGMDGRLPISASVCETVTFIDSPANEAAYPHGTKVVSVLSGCCIENYVDTRHAYDSNLMIAKIYGKIETDDSIPPELIEIATSWALEKGAHIVVAAFGSYRDFNEGTNAVSKGIDRLLESYPESSFVAAAGFVTGQEKVAVFNPAAAGSAFAISGWDRESGKHPDGGAASDRVSCIRFSGPHVIFYVRCDRNYSGSCVPMTEQFTGSSAACAYIAGILALYYEKYLHCKNKRTLILNEMIKNSTKPTGWLTERGGYGIPQPPH